MTNGGRRRASATHAVYQTLRGDVLATHLMPGTRLNIADICARLDVSLGAVREALSRLSSEGLVIAEPQRGFRVAPISTTELRDLTTVRVKVEELCLRRAIELGGSEWEAGIREALANLQRMPEREPTDSMRMNYEWTEAHTRFHDALVAACDSQWLLNLRSTLFAQSERYRQFAQSERYRQLALPLIRYRHNAAAEHEQMVDATIGRSADLATYLMGAHLLNTTKILLESGLAS